MKTSATSAFGLYEAATKADMTSTCTDKQWFVKLADLKTGASTSTPYATFEPDFWLLDGTYNFLPYYTYIHVGLMSSRLSNSGGVFSTAVVLTITFSLVHDTNGLTLRFMEASNDYCNSLQVAYYDASDVLIRSDVYAPESCEFATAQACADFKKIVITFYGTNKAYRYLRLLGIDFGSLTYITDSEIRTAVVTEEIDPVGLSIKQNSFELCFIASEVIDMLEPAGEYEQLLNHCPLDVYEWVNGTREYIGQYYLETWLAESDRKNKFTCVDRLALLAGIPCMGGLWLSSTNMEYIISDLLSVINVPYEIDADLYGIQVEGWIPVTNYREALRQIAFVCGGYVSCARSGAVRIRKMILASELSAYDYTITKAEKGMKQSLELLPQVTGVEVESFGFVDNGTRRTLFNDTLGIGVHKITFTAPAHTFLLSGASLTESGANYAIVTVTTAGTVALSGKGYDVNKKVTGVYNTGLDANIPVQIVSVKNVGLVHEGNVSGIAQRVYDYYQQRYKQSVRLFAPLASVGDSALVESLYGKQIGGVVEMMVMDLAGGFVVDAEIVGAPS